MRSGRGGSRVEEALIGLDGFAEYAAAALEVLLIDVPNVLHGSIGFHFCVGFTVFEAALNQVGNEFIEEHGMHTPVTIIRIHGDEHQLQGLFVLDIHGLEDMPPTQREQIAICFFHRVGNGRHGKGHGYQLPFRIFHQRNVFHVQHAQESIHILVYHLRGKYGEVKQLAVGPVHQIEQLAAVILFPDLFLAYLADMQVVALRNNLKLNFKVKT